MTDTRLSLLGHIKSLRKRVALSLISIILALIPTYYAYDTVIAWLLASLAHSEIPASIVITQLGEGFLVKLKIWALMAIVVTLPIHLVNALTFIFPGLSSKEKRVLSIVLIASVSLAGLSIGLTYVYLIPFSVQFLTSTGLIPSNVGIMLQFKDNLQTIINMMMMGVIVFQFPVILEELMYFNLLKRQTLISGSRYVIVIIFIISAIVTPPDVVSQIGFAIPLLLLYALTLGLAYIMDWGN